MGFGSSKPSLEEQLRTNKREINKSIRELDRERNKLIEEEKTIIRDIKQTALNGDSNLTRIMAKDLVRTRKHIQKFGEMRSQLQAVKLRLQTVKSTQSMAESMRGVAKVMVNVNVETNIPALRQAMMSFAKESEKLGLTEEMLGDVVEDATGSVGDEEEEEGVINRVLDEIGVDLAGKLLEAPVSADAFPANQQQQTATADRRKQLQQVDPIAVSIQQMMKSNNDDQLDNEAAAAIMDRTARHAPTSSKAQGTNLDQLEKSIQQRVKNLKEF